MDMGVIKQKRFTILKCVFWNLLGALVSNTNLTVLGHGWFLPQ
jgi:hypothetical protein